MNGMHSKRKIREKYPQLDGHLSELYTGKKLILAFEINFIICLIKGHSSIENNPVINRFRKEVKDIFKKGVTVWVRVTIRGVTIMSRHSIYYYIFKSLRRPFLTKYIMMISSIKPISVSFFYEFNKKI